MFYFFPPLFFISSDKEAFSLYKYFPPFLPPFFFSFSYQKSKISGSESRKFGLVLK